MIRVLWIRLELSEIIYATIDTDLIRAVRVGPNSHRPVCARGGPWGMVVAWGRGRHECGTRFRRQLRLPLYPLPGKYFVTLIGIIWLI